MTTITVDNTDYEVAAVEPGIITLQEPWPGTTAGPVTATLAASALFHGREMTKPLEVTLIELRAGEKEVAYCYTPDPDWALRLGEAFDALE